MITIYDEMVYYCWIRLALQACILYFILLSPVFPFSYLLPSRIKLEKGKEFERGREKRRNYYSSGHSLLLCSLVWEHEYFKAKQEIKTEFFLQWQRLGKSCGVGEYKKLFFNCQTLKTKKYGTQLEAKMKLEGTPFLPASRGSLLVTLINKKYIFFILKCVCVVCSHNCIKRK